MFYRIVYLFLLFSLVVIGAPARSAQSTMSNPVCTQSLCLTHLTSETDRGRFNKAGLFHEHIIYQVALTYGDHHKTLNNLSMADLKPALIIPASAPISLLQTTCNKNSCVYTLQNNNLSDRNSALFNTVVLKAQVSNPNNLKSTMLSNALTLNLPQLKSCQYQNNQHQRVKGIRVNSGALPVYEGGKALTQAEYTASAMNQLYPVPMNQMYMTDHLIAITVNEKPFLFSDQANLGIGQHPAPTPSSLDQTTCETAAAQFNTQHIAGTFVIPLKNNDIIQQCYDDKQIRFVHYAVPDGPPPSKNGWPVVILFHGYTDQTADGYYLTPADYKSGKYLPGTPFDNIFNSDWNWIPWELDSKNYPMDYESYNYYVRMRLMQTWLTRGYAVIEPATWNAGASDSWSYKPNYADPWPYTQATSDLWPTDFPNSAITYLNQSYWPGFDKQFMVALMTQIMSAQFDSANANSKMDYHNLFISGYSAGANMVSRMLNEFPSMTLNDAAKTPFPQIKAAIILSGGSYSCYAKLAETQYPVKYRYNTDVCPMAITRDATGKETSFKIIPALEEIYNSASTIGNHPPTLVAQSLYDNNAGSLQLAGTSYYDSYLQLCPAGTASCQPVPGGTDGNTAPYVPQNRIQIIHTDNVKVLHSYFPEMVIPSLNLLLDNTCIEQGKQ